MELVKPTYSEHLKQLRIFAEDNVKYNVINYSSIIKIMFSDNYVDAITNYVQYIISTTFSSNPNLIDLENSLLKDFSSITGHMKSKNSSKNSLKTFFRYTINKSCQLKSFMQDRYPIPIFRVTLENNQEI